MSESRNVNADCLKFVLIVSVVCGHLIQCFKYGGLQGYYDNIVFKSIYTFHMPLFIAVSGYYTYFSVQRRTFTQLLVSRLKYILLPLLIWGLVFALSDTLIDHDFTIVQFCRHIVHLILHHYWFIWAILIFSLILSLLHKFKLDNVFVLSVVAVAIVFVPSTLFRIDIGKMFFIYYVLAYLCAKYDITRYYRLLKKNYVLLLLIALSVAGCYLWNPLSEPWNPREIYFWQYYGFRWVLGIVSSLAVLLVVYALCDRLSWSSFKNKVAVMGQETLGIYLMQDLFFSLYSHHAGSQSDLSLPTPVLLLTSIAFCVLCYACIAIIKRNNMLAWILLGKNKPS